MRILFLYDTMDRPETELLIRLTERGIRPEVVCNSSSGFSHLLASTAIPHHTFCCRGKLDWRSVRLIRQLVTEQEFDFIHAFTARWLSTALLATVGLHRRPRIVAYRGAAGNVDWFDPLAWLTYRHPRVSKINCVSNYVREYLLDVGLAPEKLVTIYKGHEVGWYVPQGESRRSELGISRSAVLVTCIANVRPNKGVDLLLQAAELLDSSLEVEFLIVGDMRGSDIEAKAKSSRLSRRFHFTGTRTDIAELLDCSDLFVMPTRYSEGLPKAVIEAMAVGVPAIVTRIGGMPELVRDGVDGLVIEPRSALAIAQAIEALSKNQTLLQRLAVSGRRRIVDEFNIGQTAERTLEFYHGHRSH